VSRARAAGAALAGVFIILLFGWLIAILAGVALLATVAGIVRTYGPRVRLHPKRRTVPIDLIDTAAAHPSDLAWPGGFPRSLVPDEVLAAGDWDRWESEPPMSPPHEMPPVMPGRTDNAEEA
jgi:hypothetical protein